MTEITIINSGVANIGSLVAALDRLGVASKVTGAAEDVANADAVILPGVGAFADGMAALRRNGLVAPIQDAAARGTPVLGVCLGMQLLVDRSEEFGSTEGLGLIPGAAVRLTPSEPGERVPNIGWCDVTPNPAARLFQDFPTGAALYFVHSYHVVCEDEGDVAATLSYGGGPIAAALERGSIFGIQAHPEKSQDAGFLLLSAFVDFSDRRNRPRYAA